LGAKPLHRIAPSKMIIAPIITRNFPSSPISQEGCANWTAAQG
jgi:hypothetical protein